MRRIFLILVVSLLFVRLGHCKHDGGAAVAGALGGLAVGTMITHAAMESDKRGRVEEKIEQERRERDLEKIRELEKRIEKKELIQKIEKQKKEGEKLREQFYTDKFTIFLVGIVLLLFLILLGIGITFILRKNKT